MAKIVLAIAVLAAIWLFWRRGRGGVNLTVAEARATLDLRENADETAIRDAHRRLIAKVHPDAGGNAALAARINAARDVLLREHKKEIR